MGYAKLYPRSTGSSIMYQYVYLPNMDMLGISKYQLSLEGSAG